MIRAVGIVIVFVILAVSLLHAGNTEQSTGEVNEWVGKHYDDLIAAYGKPSKIKRGEDGTRTVIFKIPITGELVVQNRSLEVGIGDNAYIEANGHITATSAAGSHFIDTPSEPHAIVLGKQKLTFYLSADGIIERVEVTPVKWKKRAMERSLAIKKPPKEEQEEE